MRSLLAVVDRHEVDHLAHAVLRQKAGDEDVRVRHVELLRRPLAPDGSDPEEAAALGVEDRSEHARPVEAVGAEPVDRAVGADERGRVQVADDAVLRDRQVVMTRGVGHAAILRLAWGGGPEAAPRNCLLVVECGENVQASGSPGRRDRGHDTGDDGDGREHREITDGHAEDQPLIGERAGDERGQSDPDGQSRALRRSAR